MATMSCIRAGLAVYVYIAVLVCDVLLDVHGYRIVWCDRDRSTRSRQVVCFILKYF